MAVQIPLRNRRKEVVAYALVDAEDEERLNAHRWCRSSAGYAKRAELVGGKHYTIYMHREVLGLGPTDPRQGDHINRNPLDNRKTNLRVVTHAQQAHNVSPQRGTSSKHRGVSWFPRTSKWVAHGAVNGKQHNLGYFADEDEAARVVAAWRAEHMTHAVD